MSVQKKVEFWTAERERFREPPGNDTFFEAMCLATAYGYLRFYLTSIATKNTQTTLLIAEQLDPLLEEGWVMGFMLSPRRDDWPHDANGPPYCFGNRPPFRKDAPQ